MLMGGQAEGLACADPVARTPIGVSGNYITFQSLLMPRCISQAGQIPNTANNAKLNRKVFLNLR